VGSEIRVEPLREAEFDEWTDFVTACPDGTICSIPRYLDPLCCAAGGRFVVLGARRGGELPRSRSRSGSTSACRDTLSVLAATYRMTRVVRVTVASTVTQTGAKAVVTHLLGRAARGERENQKRDELKNWLRRTCAAEPILDLATIESRTAIGAPVTFECDAHLYSMRHSPSSNDGQHLTKECHRAVAPALLDLPGRLAKDLVP